MSVFNNTVDGIDLILSFALMSDPWLFLVFLNIGFTMATSHAEEESGNGWLGGGEMKC
ncbi:hypothetical protein GCM10007916_21220 [Psychromonas marina]|uniref:Uncharacterized protein n=1 Tax=Psychromonas marina TaxID=88364 RepID=A0ABQ6E0U7_9GAMM|nr:hypothetical protein [Psychromonas marina]GLS91054.1 hypothetical protein GCM10007916_21220 [Psychromonas marina]